MVLFGVSVNIVAVIVGTIVAMIIGFVWYSVLFRKQWMDSMKKSGNKSKMEMSASSMGGAVLGALFSVFVLEVLLKAIHVSSYTIGLELAALVWLGFYVAMELVSLSFKRNDSELFIINVAHHAVVLGIVSLILVAMG